jgi:hypothetical protein
MAYFGSSLRVWAFDKTRFETLDIFSHLITWIGDAFLLIALLSTVSS